MRPILKIDDFSEGILADKTIQTGKGFSYGVALDIATEWGKLQPSYKTEAMGEDASPNDITDGITWMRYYNNYVYGLGNGGSNRIYRYDTSWSLVHDDSNVGWGQGMEVYGSNLYWASNGYLGTYDGTTWTDSFQSFAVGDTHWHPMKVFMGKLMIGDGRYIATWDGTVWNATALTLPVGYKVRCLEVYGDRLAIGTWRGSNIYDYNDAILFTWDGDETHTYEQAINVHESGILSMGVWENRLWVIAGVKGNIYVYNGSLLEKFPTPFPGDFSGGDWMEVYPDAMEVWKGRLLIAKSGGNNKNSIYELVKNLRGKIAMSSFLTISEEVSDALIQIYSVKSLGTGSLYFSRVYNSVYGVDKINIDRRADAIWESQVYEVENGNQPRLIKGIELQAEPMASGVSVDVKYDLGESGSWTTLGTINSTNQDNFLPLLKRAKRLQIRLELNPSGLTGDSPKISKILVY